MPEADPRAELGEACRRLPPPPPRAGYPSARPPATPAPVTGRVRRRELQQPPGRGGQRIQLAAEALLDPARQRRRRRQAEAACQLRGRQAARQLQQGQRVTRASRSRSGPAPARPTAKSAPNPAGPARRRPATRPPAARAARQLVPGTLAPNTKPTGSAASRRAANPSACAEARSSHCWSSTTQISGRSPATSDRRLSDSQPNQEQVRRRACAQAERGRQRVPLRLRQGFRRGEHGRAQLMQPREGQLHLRLHPAARATRQPNRRLAG